MRSGYTTGACAAAAAKAATMLLVKALALKSVTPEVIGSGDYPSTVDIPFPDDSRVNFKIHNSGLKNLNSQQFKAWASVIKDAGDDPDVTNGAQIVAEVSFALERGSATINERSDNPSEVADGDTAGVAIKGGRGVGRVTKPGLPVPVGDSAINPVPRRMIREAVLEALREANPRALPDIEITISVPDGEELAKKTLNSRLGIIGGISILGTSGIVKPLSSEAWTASITASMDVARALNSDEVVVSAGRVSEKAHMKQYDLPDTVYVMMGDYLEFSLLDAKRHGFTRIHLCAQWAKMLKIAMATPQTHVRHGAIDIETAVRLLNSLGVTVPQDADFNTAREVLDYIISVHRGDPSLLRKVCNAAKRYAEGITGGISVVSHLVSYHGEILARSE